MVVWTEERWRSHTPPRLERRRAAHRRRRGRGHKPGCWGLHTPRRLERRGAAHQLAGRVQTNNPVWGGSLAVLGLAGKGRLASFSRHSHCMAGPPSEAERPLWRQLRHGMPQQRARRTPRSTQRAAQSHRSDLVALELRGAKLLSQPREIHLRYCSAAVRPLVTGVHTSDVPAPAATLSSATLASGNHSNPHSSDRRLLRPTPHIDSHEASRSRHELYTTRQSG